MCKFTVNKKFTKEVVTLMHYLFLYLIYKIYLTLAHQNELINNLYLARLICLTNFDSCLVESRENQ